MQQEPSSLNPFVQKQLERLKHDYSRPLIITDADEVLFQFMAGLEEFIHDHELFFDWSSFALTGNIRRTDTKQALPSHEVKDLLAKFFAQRTAVLVPVQGAASALKSLAEVAEVIVLSNVPQQAIKARKDCLRRNGMDYPMIANTGPKGPAVRYLTCRKLRTAVFIDDLPPNHRSVAEHAEHVLRIHFVAHPKLGKLVGPAALGGLRLNTWSEIETTIRHHFSATEPVSD